MTEQNGDLMRWFDHSHLTDPELKAIFEPFTHAARAVNAVQNSAETRTSIRKLIEAKDCAVRALLHQRERRAASDAP